LFGYFPVCDKFLINYSRGYLYQCPIEFSQTLNAYTCNANWVRGKVTSGFGRAMLAAEFKSRTHDYWNDFLAFSAAGNANDGRTDDGFLAVIYPGVADIFATSMMNSVVDPDPFFGFADKQALWDRQSSDPNLPFSIKADPAQVAQIHDTVVHDRVDAIAGAPNIMLVGSVTAGSSFANL